MSCRCPMAPDGPAPCAHSGDGCTDLVIVRETSRANYVKFLLRCKDTKSDQVRISLGESFDIMFASKNC